MQVESHRQLPRNLDARNLWLCCAIALVLLGVVAAKASDAVPSDYPRLVITNSAGAAPGNWIGSLGGGGPDGTSSYFVILDNTGTVPLFVSATNTLLRFFTPQGFATATDGGFRFKDELLQIVDTFTTLGYSLDSHDIKLLPNGHALLLGQEGRLFDLSTVVPGGKRDTRVEGSIIQELDADKRLVFEWHSLDHIAITDSFVDLAQYVVDYTHINSVALDPTDNHLLVSLRNTSEIVKINRASGQIMWRLGGKMNQFTFVGEHAENAPYFTAGQHDVHRLANGNLLFFDNGSLMGQYLTAPPRHYSRVLEYALDEGNKTATLVWEYRHTPDIEALCQGSVKRFANGNTLVDWGCGISGSGIIVTEVSRGGDVVFEMRHAPYAAAGAGGSLTKEVWNSPDLVRSTIHHDIQAGQAYHSPEAGASLAVQHLSGASNNTLVLERHLDAVRFPRFAGKAPQVVMEHLVLWASNLISWEAVLQVNLPDTRYVFDTPMIHDPAQVMIYHRATPGQGVFSPLPTTFDVVTRQLRATSTQPGEFIFAYPDVSETPHVPLLRKPDDHSIVSQSQPVTLVWSPPGLVSSFELQLAVDAAFSNRVLNLQGLGTNSASLQKPLSNTSYFWRVRSVNQGGTSDWASASFTALPPAIQVTVPAGGEVWQRYQTVTVRWTDNIAEPVAIDLYKGGVSNQPVANSISSSGAYAWTITGLFQPITPGSNYTLRVRSTTDPSLFSVSAPFAIADPTSITVATQPVGLTATVDGTNYTTPARFLWLPGSSHILDTPSPQVAADGHTPLVFASWSDGGSQSHAFTVPATAFTCTARFATNYALRGTAISVTRTGGVFYSTWSGVPGLQYTIEFASALDGPWAKYETGTAGADGLFSMTLIGHSNTVFFRTCYPAY